MLGPPDFPEASIPSWEEFRADYTVDYFDGTQAHIGRSLIIEVNGLAVGHISYSSEHLPDGCMELDIWMESLAQCGKGFGSEAIEALIAYLHDSFGVKRFIMRPSQRNVRAIKAYIKAGFANSPLSDKEQEVVYGAGEYVDTITLERNV